MIVYRSRAEGILILTLVLVLLTFLAGCAGGPALRYAVKPSESKRQYLGLKKIAVMPLNNIGGSKGAEDQALYMLINELNIINTFEEVEDPRYVSGVLKALKIRKIEDLDLETVQKLGSETKAQCILLGDIHAWGLGQGADAAMGVSMTLTLIDTTTGKPIWVGNGSKRASFTVGRAFGLNEGPTDLEVARDVVISLLKSLNKDIQVRRDDELARIKIEEEAKLKAAAEAEKRRLEEMLKQE